MRLLAGLRFACVVLALYVCVLQLLHIGFWSAPMDRTLILAGILIGLGPYGDTVDPVWQALGNWARLCLFSILAVVVLGTVMAPDFPIWFISGIVMISAFLCAMGYELLIMLADPLRAARFRQMKRYLRLQPRKDRRALRDRLERNFQTLVAEGFH